MIKKLRVNSEELKVKTGMILLTIILLFLTFNFLSSTLLAEEIASKAALVMEASTSRVLYAKNPNLKLHPASTTKLVTAIVVLDNANVSDTVTISKKAVEIHPGSENKFKEGERVTIEKILYAVLMESANDAAFAAAETIAASQKEFVSMMNKKVVSIGAKNTLFANVTGHTDNNQHVTAYDLARIMRYALKYPELKEIIATKSADITTLEGRTILLENTNRLLWTEDGVIGGKTGYTKKAKNCLVYAAERNNETLIVAVLGAPSREVLWDEAARLAEKGFDVMANNEQPVVYFTKSDYKNLIKKASYKKVPEQRPELKNKKTKKNLKPKQSKKNFKREGTNSEIKTSDRMADGAKG
jgi:D-alanyl-D-alanine carboxypeptidase (penicillin-binding protein 5/6)